MILNIGRVQGTARPWFFIEIDGIRMARDAFQRRPRNALRDAITNIANVSIFKEVKLHEHVSFTFHTTMLNALNHPNFVTVDRSSQMPDSRARNRASGGWS